MLDEKKINIKHYVEIHVLLWRSSPRLKSGGFRANFILVIYIPTIVTAREILVVLKIAQNIRCFLIMIFAAMEKGDEYEKCYFSFANHFDICVYILFHSYKNTTSENQRKK